ncbi:MAG: UTP--glucose-1-phosphate uridylyltransferase [Bifidobacteriaceae bacterium]|jgi:UTP--glucose-1-phosphate uridylyltransferase|nr:UTP--glucose-1-phosphate uridylyltransferase [Bifidobacteriaceae bacterium]
MVNVEALNSCKEKMQKEGINSLHISIFEKYFNQLFSDSDVGYIPESEVEGVKNLDSFESLTSAASDEEIKSAVIIKLNGGLATTMGLDRAKVLLQLKDGKNFLDYIVDAAKLDNGIRVPLIFMDSFRTSQDTLNYLSKYDFLQDQGFPLDFLQSKEPKIDFETYYPAVYNQDPSLEWCPPGHGDIYASLFTSGILEKLINSGIKYAFISNADNLAARFDARILKYIIDNDFSFCSELTRKTENDIKGGHIVKRGSRYVLREFSQIPPSDKDDALNPENHPFVNTNNVWVNLHHLLELIKCDNGYLGLPLIKNVKNVNPQDKSLQDKENVKVIQLETAMGAGIGAFENVGLLEIPRTRFLPVKDYADLDRLKAVL